VYDVVLLSLASGAPAGSDACGIGGSCCGGADQQGAEQVTDRSCAEPGTRVPVLACGDVLTAAGARVEYVTARSDAEIDDVLARLDGPPREDGLTWPDPESKTRVVIAAASDAQIRAVVRRLVRRFAPPPSRRPADLAESRTVPDLPALGVLPLDPARTGTPDDLVALLGLPREPATVAAAVLGDRVRRIDLLRTDAGSVTLDGTLLAGKDADGKPLPWRGRVQVDDAVLSDGEEGILACAVGNAGGYAQLDGIPLLSDADPGDGTVEVAVAVPVMTRARFRRPRLRIEVRRARGRAASVTPRDGEVQFVDDGVAGTLNRKRSWWTEAGAWAAYVS
jgi:hypothetical protein